MPRVETLERPIAASTRPRSTRARKPVPPQDRLTQRTLFFRRVRRSSEAWPVDFGCCRGADGGG